MRMMRMVQSLAALCLLCLAVHAHAATSFQADHSLGINIDLKTGAATGNWLSIRGGASVQGWGNLTCEGGGEVTRGYVDANFGRYTKTKFVWKGSNAPLQTLETSFLVFLQHEMVIFEQHFPNGWNNSDPKQQSNDPPNTPSGIMSGFPSIDPQLLTSELSYLLWGGCFLTDIHSGRWNSLRQPDDLPKLFNGHTHGQPWVIHDKEGRTMVMSSLDNFFVSGFGYNSTDDTIQEGPRTSLERIPADFRHSTVLVAGQGINATLMQWGDVLLTRGGGKRRSQVYSDFVLAHAGYFTDNGAYHYQAAHEAQYDNMEEALMGVRDGLAQKKVPIRYIQWDDWWMENEHDLPGMISWAPKPEVFPSGFTDWLKMPLAMYAPAYNGKNVWIDDYKWRRMSTQHGDMAIPLDPQFYVDLFTNGTRIGMKFFEQDFLCSYGIGGTGLTSMDVDSGRQWLQLMDEAALVLGIKLQLCMPDAYHVLQSTTMNSVTNARATGDNTRSYPSILSMGQNSLLFHALGIYASRDNIWTSNVNVEQKGCGNTDFCYETNAPLDNAVAVLSNGPYGIGDAVAHVNRTIVMYACRDDGYMLRPRWPLASLDFVFTDPPEVNSNKAPLIWAAHDDFGGFRWSYIIGVNVNNPVGFTITPTRLAQGAVPVAQQMVAWKVVPGEPVTKVQVFADDNGLLLDNCEPFPVPHNLSSPCHVHYGAAPVLPSGIVLLGEVDKWATMSFGRVSSLVVTSSTSVTVEIIGVPGETVKFVYLKNTDTTALHTVSYKFPRGCSSNTDQHGNPICEAVMICAHGCVFADSSETGLRSSVG